MEIAGGGLFLPRRSVGIETMTMLKEIETMRISLAEDALKRFENKKYDELEFSNIAENHKRREGILPSLVSLRGYLHDQTAFIVAAGESLEKNYQHLAKIRNTFQSHLISVDRSAWYLAERGVFADSVVSIDGIIDKSIYDGKPKPYPDPDEETHLWTVATCHPGFVDRWPGPVFFALPLFQGNEEGYERARAIVGDFPRMGSGGNCSTTALAMCHYAGAKRIVFVGHDFCVDEKCYAGGGGGIPVIGDSGWKNIHGKDVRVPYSYLMPKLWTEEVIMGFGKEHGYEYINATEGGILGITKNGDKIDNLTFMPLEEAIAKYAPEIVE